MMWSGAAALMPRSRSPMWVTPLLPRPAAAGLGDQARLGSVPLASQPIRIA